MAGLKAGSKKRRGRRLNDLRPTQIPGTEACRSYPTHAARSPISPHHFLMAGEAVSTNLCIKLLTERLIYRPEVIYTMDVNSFTYNLYTDGVVVIA